MQGTTVSRDTVVHGSCRKEGSEAQITDEPEPADGVWICTSIPFFWESQEKVDSQQHFMGS